MNSDLDDIRAERYSEIGRLIRSNASTVIDAWMSAARDDDEQDSAKSAHRDELRNQLPHFLEHLGAELGTHGNSRQRQRDATAKNHGEERWNFGWRLDEVIRDYQLLRIVLLDHLDECLSRRLDLEEIKAIGVLLDDAIEDAVTTYVTFQEKRVADNELQSHGTFENAAVGIAHVDEEGRWLRANDRLCKMLGYTVDEIMQMRFEQFIHPEDGAGQKARLDQLLTGDLPYFAAEMRLSYRDGQAFWVNSTVSLQRSSTGKPLYFILVIEDISARKQLDRELEEARIAAEEGSRLKSEFVANVSHEIRTPMNAILGMTELALDEHLTDELRDYIATAHESAKSLLSLVNDLLDFSRIEARKLELESMPFDLWQTIDETAKALSINASEKGLELLTDVSESVPRYAKGDALRLRQIITNLVSNAIKFTERGEVVIRAALQASENESSVVRFSVTDTGIGITAEEKERIFAPFTQADASTTRVFGGSGLGLAICTELIRRLGGTLDVNSTSGEGSEFFFTARFDHAEPPRELVERRDKRIEQLRGSRILVVDDNATNRAILERALSQLAIEVDSFDNGDAAITRLRLAAEANAPYDVVLVDALMPGRDGFSVIEEINSDEQLQSTTVLMLSSADRSTFVDRTANLEIDGFLDKPVTSRELVKVLSTARFGTAADEDGRGDSTGSIIPTTLRILVVEDTPANQKVVQAILRKRGHNVTLANNGREAIDKLCVESFDVVLMDVQMPTVDGYQATRAIRDMEDESVSSLPIIAMTAHAMKGDADRCIEIGMNDYISKPIDSQRLVKLVEKWGGANTATHGDPTLASSGEADAVVAVSGSPGSKVADFDAALARLDGNRKLLHDMIIFFREDVPKLLHDIETGLTEGDSDLVKRSAHSIKGLAANFDGERLAEVALSIERLGELNRLDEINERLPALRAELIELESALDQFAAQP